MGEVPEDGFVMSASYPGGGATATVDFARRRVRVRRTKHGAVENGMEATVAQAEGELAPYDQDHLVPLVAAIEHQEMVDGKVPTNWFVQLHEVLTVHAPEAPRRTSYGPDTGAGHPHAAIASWCMAVLDRLLGAAPDT